MSQRRCSMVDIGDRISIEKGEPVIITSIHQCGIRYLICYIDQEGKNDAFFEGDYNFSVVKQMNNEKCVMCEKDTKYYISTPISKRLYYIEGAGQLCKICYKNIYE